MMRFWGRKRIILRIIFETEEDDDGNSNIDVCCLYGFWDEKYLII